MLVCRSPLRLTLGGGATDLPCYAQKYGGFVVSSALNKHVYVLVKERFEREIRASYSVTEICKSPKQIHHPVIREALQLTRLNSHLEIVSSADMPSETGLGSSGSFTVCLLQALHAFRGEHLSKRELAEEATNLVINILREPCGPQDTCIAAYGGFIKITVGKDGHVNVDPLTVKPDVMRELENNLLFFYTGMKRRANFVLEAQNKNVANDANALESMHRIKKIGFEVAHALEIGDLHMFGLLQSDHWNAKKTANPEASNGKIDRLLSLGVKAGAVGAKLMGAGGGGFLMFYMEDGKDKLRKVMVREGLLETRFLFEKNGSKVMLDT